MKHNSSDYIRNWVVVRNRVALVFCSYIKIFGRLGDLSKLTSTHVLLLFQLPFVVEYGSIESACSLVVCVWADVM